MESHLCMQVGRRFAPTGLLRTERPRYVFLVAVSAARAKASTDSSGACHTHIPPRQERSAAPLRER